MYSYGTPHMAGKKQDDQLEHTSSSYVRIQGVALKTCQRRWTIGRSGEGGSGISVPAARHDDDDSTPCEFFASLVLHWCLSDSKSRPVFRTLLSILADLNNAVIRMVSIYPLISNFPCRLSKGNWWHNHPHVPHLV